MVSEYRLSEVGEGITMFLAIEDVNLFPRLTGTNDPLIIRVAKLTFPSKVIPGQSVLILCEVRRLLAANKQYDDLFTFGREHASSECLVGTIAPRFRKLLSGPF